MRNLSLLASLGVRLLSFCFFCVFSFSFFGGFFCVLFWVCCIFMRGKA